MNKLLSSLTAYFLFSFAAMLSWSSPAQAQLFHTWVASNGSDAANCDRATPCQSFFSALSKTTAGGEISCVDSGNYYSANITKSVTINCEGAIGSNLLGVSGGYIFTITTAASDIVVLKGLDLDGAGSTLNFTQVAFNGAGTLILDKMKIANLPGGNGLQFAPNGPSHLVISNSLITGNGGGLLITPSGTANVLISNSVISNNGPNGNVLIKPTGSAPIAVTFKTVNISNSVFGIKADGSGQASGQIDVDVSDSVAAHHTNNGFIAVSDTGQAPIHYKVTRSAAFNNGAYGVVATGAQAFMIVDNSSLTKNGTGLAQLNGSTVATYGNVAVNYNTTQITGTITPISLH